jgi:predicted Zn-dependent peptidase
VSYCGFAVNAGARDETLSEHGLAHFVEHTLFKGTAKRKTWHILNRMENVGGELNAYTTKENTFLYTVFPDSELERAVELLADLIANSVFPEKELVKEREVIIDEIESYQDSPAELIFDDFENLLFDQHPLGHNILGNKRSVRSFTAASCRSFIDRFYTAPNMVFFCMTDKPFRRVVYLSEKYFSQINANNAVLQRHKPDDITPVNIVRKKKTHISHVLMGCRSFDIFHPQRFQLYLLNNILGGPGMNNRLNVSLREKHGLVYTVESNVSACTDTGTFSIYLGVAPENREQAIELVNNELNSLCNRKLSTLQLAAAIKQAVGQIGVAYDNKESRFLGLGKMFLLCNTYEDVGVIISAIRKITAEQLLETANNLLVTSNMTSLIYQH